MAALTGDARLPELGSSRGPGTRVLQAVTSPLLVLLGVAMTLRATEDQYLATFGLLLIGTGSILLATLLLERQWDRSRPGPALSVGPDGVASTLLARAGWSLPLRWAITAALSIPTGLAGLLALSEQRWALAVVLLAAVVLVGLKTAPRGGAGGLHLTPDGVVVDDHGRRRSTGWDEVAAVVPVNAARLELRDGSTVPLAPFHLAAHPAVVLLALQRCVVEPSLRAELGTPASLRWPLWRLGP